MEIFKSWSQVGDMIRTTTPAGPIIGSADARASVARLRHATEWARPMLPRISGFEVASEKVSQVDPLVVDRHGLIRVLVESLHDERNRFSAQPGFIPAGGSLANIRGIGGLIAVRKLSGTVQGFWRFSEANGQRILVAPNVWEMAEQRKYDKGDYSRWVALRTGLWGVYFIQAPWLAGYLQHLFATLPSSLNELTRLLFLFSEIVNVQLNQMTPRDIPSINWIKSHLPRSGTSNALDQLRTFNSIGHDSLVIRSQVDRFVSFLKLHTDTSALSLLLLSADHLPTLDELDMPELWAERVRFGC